MSKPTKPRRGRPPLHGTTMVKVRLFLGPQHIARAIKLGAGNLSAGIRRALEKS